MKTNFRYPIEFFALVALVIFVPSLEAPKNIFWLVFVVTWLINRIRDKNFGGAWDFWDSLIGLWIFSGYLISAFAGLHSSEWGGANDILRYGSIFWAIKRSGYSRNELLWLAIAIVFSTTIALGYGLWDLFVAHTRHALQLNSVGHVNHSAIYLAISYGALLSLVLAFWGKSNAGMRIFGSLLTVLFAVSIFISASRGAVGVTLLTTIILGIAWLRRSKYPLIILLVASTLLTGGAYMTKVEVVQKQEADVKAGIILSYRDVIWNTALVAWRKYPLFGVGMHNYNQISMDKVKTWLKESGKPYLESQYGGTSHAHSLYMNTLAERGLVGMAVLFSVLLSWLYWLVRFAPQGNDEDLAWVLWGGSFSAWFVTVGIGLVNTTLHHEHAILSVMLLGMWLAYLKMKHRSATA
ncbi:MAG: O-antigen ligase family protein [Sulfuricella sp.]